MNLSILILLLSCTYTNLHCGELVMTETFSSLARFFINSFLFLLGSS